MYVAGVYDVGLGQAHSYTLAVAVEVVPVLPMGGLDVDSVPNLTRFERPWLDHCRLRFLYHRQE